MAEFSEPDFGDSEEPDFGAGFGHNGGPAMDFEGEEVGNPDIMTAAAQSRMKSFVERIERVQEEKDAAANDMKEIYAEAKGEGYDTKVLRKVIARRKQDKVKREEEEALIDLYESALEMVK